MPIRDERVVRGFVKHGQGICYAWSGAKRVVKGFVKHGQGFCYTWSGAKRVVRGFVTHGQGVCSTWSGVLLNMVMGFVKYSNLNITNNELYLLKVSNMCKKTIPQILICKMSTRNIAKYCLNTVKSRFCSVAKAS